MITVARRYTFEAAHRLPKTPKTHKCHTMHGHSYVLEIELAGTPDPEMGWFVDFADIDFAVLDRVIYPCDHKTLNEIPGLEIGTLEVFVPWIWSQLKSSPQIGRYLSRVVINEGPHSRAEYRGDAS